jgi:hypothetical protein
VNDATKPTGSGGGLPNDSSRSGPPVEKEYPPEKVELIRVIESRRARISCIFMLIGIAAALFCVGLRWDHATQQYQPAINMSRLYCLLPLAGWIGGMVYLASSNPDPWVCPVCRSQLLRTWRVSRRGKQLRPCDRCRIDWDTGQSVPADSGGGN